MNKTWWLAAGLLLFLAGCRQTPVPEQVDYPGDARVPHGSWLLEPITRSGGAEFTFDAAAKNLIVRDGEGHSRYSRSGETWSHSGSGRPAGIFDPSLDAFVQVEWNDRQANVTIRDFLGEVSSTTVIELPDGVSPGSFRAAAGIVVGLSGTATDGTTIHWWDVHTGELLGSHSVMPHPDGMTVSSDGRLLTFWHLSAYKGTVFSFDNPGSLVQIRQGACRSSRPGELSADGRWLVTSNCLGNVALYDLHDSGRRVGSLDIDSRSYPRFGSDSAEIVWFRDSNGAIVATDVTDGSNSVLLTVPAEDANHMADRQLRVYLNRAEGILAYDTHRGLMRVVDLVSGSVTSLPPFEIEGVMLELVSSPPEGQEAPYDYLDLEGSWLLDGTELLLSGHALGGSHHRYVPGDLGTSMAPPPPPASVYLQVLNPDDSLPEADRVVWELSAETDSNRSPVYEGTLRGPGGHWTIRLVRP